jgi:hypothetical protein
MNRKQRRAKGITDRPKTYTMTEEQLTELKYQHSLQGIKYAVTGLSAVIVMALHDEFRFGVGRCKKALKRINDKFECVLAGTVELDDMISWCKEFGIEIAEMEE